MLFARYFVYFSIFSYLGWIYECIYCTCKTGHWQNRGFLFGPVCPIYGAGAVSVCAIYDQIPAVNSGQVALWQLFIVFMVGSAVLEFVTSWVLEKRFHARWWDYSDLPLNLQGRICLPISIAFGILGIVIFKFVVPLLNSLHPLVHPLLMELAALGFAGLFGADTSLSVASMSHLIAMMQEAEDQLNTNMEFGVQAVRQIPEMVSEKAEEVKQLLSDPKQMIEETKLTLREARHLNNVRLFDNPHYKEIAEKMQAYRKEAKQNDADKK